MELLAVNDGNHSWTVSQEVELVWRVHALNPVHYAKDCLRRFGKVIPHRCDNPIAEYRTHSQMAFRNKVLGNQAPKRTGFISRDLVMTDAIKTYCNFMQKIVDLDIGEMTIKDYVKRGIDRYEQLLSSMWSPGKLKRLEVVLTSDIYLIWHSQQLEYWTQWVTSRSVFCPVPIMQRRTATMIWGRMGSRRSHLLAQNTETKEFVKRKE